MNQNSIASAVAQSTVCPSLQPMVAGSRISRTQRLGTAASRRDFIRTASIVSAGLFSSSYLPSAAAESVPLAPPGQQAAGLEILEPVTKEVGWAVVGLGKLTVEEILPAFPRARYSNLNALVSGHSEKAEKLARTYGVNSTAIYDYKSFDRIIDDPSIEAVYIVLPNSMHAEYTIRALEAGKHVLCEKPMAVTLTECDQMLAAAKKAQRKLMIAYRLHYEPFNLKVVELLRSKQFGEIRTIASSNCQNVEAPNIRLSKELGGGPLGDIGIYSINATRYITNEEPVAVTAIMHQPTNDPRFREVPESFAFTLKFASGILAHCDCSFGAAESRRYRVHCTEGLVELDPAFSYRGLRLHTQRQGTTAELLLPEVNHFTAEMDHFSQCILDDSNPKTPGEMGKADMQIIAAIEKAAATGRTITVQDLA